jgi:hypothetical protein
MFFRLMIAFVALAVAAAHVFLPEMKIDITTFALVVVAFLLVFAPGIRVKALDLMGVKVEFEKADVAETPASAGTHDGIKEGSQLPQADGYATRVAKLTPVETIAPYAMTTALIENSFKTRIPPEWILTTLWLAFAIFLFAMPVFYSRSLGGPWNAQAKWQTASAVVIFLGWCLLLGGPFRYLGWYDPVYGVLLLAFGTFAVPLRRV